MRRWLSTGWDGVTRSNPDRVTYVGVFLLAISLRILYLLVARPVFESPYWTLSTSLLQNGSLSIDGVRTAAFEPGYPVFLATVRAVVGDRVLLVQAVQCIVAALGAVFLCRLATVLSGKWQVGVIAGVIYAVYPLLVRHSADRSDAALMTMLLIAFASEFVAASTPVRAAGAGLWLGLAVLTRAMALPLVPLGAAIQWRDRGWRSAAVLTVSALVVVAPYAIRNYTLNGSVWPTRSGINLFISNSEYSANILPNYGPDILEDYAISVVERSGATAGLTGPAIERAYDALWTRYAVDEIRRHPWRTAGLKVRNVFYLFSPRLVPYHEPTPATTIQLGENGAFTVEHSPPRRAVDQIVYAISYTPVLGLALAGVWLRRRELSRDAILWCVLATFVVAHAVYFPTTRYRVPIEFVLLFYASVTLDASAVPRIMKTLKHLFKLSRQDLAIVTEAVIVAIPVEIALRCVRLDTLVARLGRVSRTERPQGDELDVERAARLVEAVAAYYPLRATCLKKSLVLFRILRKRGIPAELQLGVRKVHDDFTSHAWLECRGRVLLGEGITHFYRALPAVTRTE